MSIDKTNIDLNRKLNLYDEKYFEGLYESLHPELMTYGIKICRNEDYVMDSIHEVFLDLWQHKSRLDKIDQKKPYIFRSLRNHLINRIRIQERFLPAYDSTASSQQDGVPFTISQEEIIIGNEDEAMNAEKVRDLLANLTDHQREIVFLKYYSGLSDTQIAEITGMKVQSVRNHLSKSLRKLREVIIPVFLIFFV
ncbi:MAG: RNA polymerase sigma factor [Cyclobacteriaceae bacterium]|nr:RNA polymerase sigma factor [Cyclobacteriaceae bacterium]